MTIEKPRFRSVLMLIAALSLAGCMVEMDSEQPSAEKFGIRAEVTVTFDSPASAEAAAAVIDRLDDGSMVFGVAGVSFDALVTDAARSWLLDNPTLIAMDDLAQAKNHGSGYPSCVGHCGEFIEGQCGCDYWCFLFGDCCPDYYEICE